MLIYPYHPRHASPLNKAIPVRFQRSKGVGFMVKSRNQNFHGLTIFEFMSLDIFEQQKDWIKV
tara:strand:- start:802 stop:990 length:189 start_codon:yes stop_codon:yes gene_type:complete